MSAGDERRGREHRPGCPETQAPAQCLPCQVTPSLGTAWPAHLNSPQRHSICTPPPGHTCLSPIGCLPASFSLQAFPSIKRGQAGLPGGTQRENERKKLPKRLAGATSPRTRSSISVKEPQPSPERRPLPPPWLQLLILTSIKLPSTLSQPTQFWGSVSEMGS